MVATARQDPVYIAPEFAHETVNVASLVAMPELYRNYPSFQRRFRWPTRLKQWLIDSILKGIPVPAISCYRDKGDDGVTRYQVIDGKQRLETIFAYISGEFATTRAAIHGQAPSFPGKLYRQLPLVAQNRIKTYSLQLQIWTNFSPDVHADVFRRMANVLPLSKPEVIMTFDSEANARAEYLAKHDWLNTHLSKVAIERSTAHYFALALLLLHHPTQRFSIVQASTLENFARGVRDDTMDIALAERMALGTLNALNLLAPNAGIVSLYDLVVLVQGVRILLDAGYDPRTMPRDMLSDWLPMVRQRVNAEDPFPGISKDAVRRPYTSVTTATNQQAFVTRYGPSLIEMARARGANPTVAGSRAAAR